MKLHAYTPSVPTLIFFLLILSSHYANATVQKLTQTAEFVIEGTVIDKQAYWNEQKTAIFTDNKIKIKHIFKGNITDSVITVVTFGGEVDNAIQFQMHAIELSTSKSGFLFLNKNKNKNKKYDFISNGYAKINDDLSPKVIALGQSYFKKEFENEITFETKAPKLTFNEHLNWLALKQTNLLDTCISIPAKQGEHKIEFSFANPHLSKDLQYLEFDILAAVNTPGLRFGRAKLFVKYTKEFGSNVIKNDAIIVEKGDIIKHELYSLKIADANEQAFYAGIEAGTGYFDFYPLTAKPQSLLKVKIKLSVLNTLGKISFDDLAIDGDVYYMCYGEYYKFENIVFDNPLNHLVPQPDDPIGSKIDINYTLKNEWYLEAVNVFTVDLFAESSTASDFVEGTICMDYNALAFGDNVVSNSTATFVKSNFLDDYNVTLQDIANNTLLIHTQYSNGAHSSITNQSVYLGRLYFSEINCDYNKNITFNPIMLSENHLHYNGVFNLAYDSVIANDELTGLVCGFGPDPVINSFTPSIIPAGNGDILTIKGSNFGTYNNQYCTVQFKNGDDGGNFNSTMSANTQDFIIAPNVLGWKDDEIKLKVPSVDATAFINGPACSGRFKVVNAVGTVESVAPLKIPYAVTNVRRSSKAKKIAIKEQGDDGICFTYSTTIPGWVKTQFESALSEWCIKTGINFYIDENEVQSNTASATDGINLISSETTSDGSPAATIFSNDAIKECNGGGEDGVFITDIDIKINPSYTNIFNPTNADITKLRNRLKHELGHAHMINHSVMLDPNGNPVTASDQYIVYYTFDNVFGTPNITIKSNDREGAEQVFANSQQILSGIDVDGNNCGFPISYGLCLNSCETLIDNIPAYNTLNGVLKVWIESNNNIAFSTDQINLTNAEFLIIDCAGRVRHHYFYQNLSSKAHLPINLNSGIYYVNLKTPEGYTTQKILVL